MIGQQGTVAVAREDDQRVVRRRIVSISAYAREADLALFEVRVMDLSTEGCRIEGAIDLEQATRIWIKIPGVTPRAALVAWGRAGEAGCRFEDPICEELVAEVARNSRRPASELRSVFRARHFG